MSAGGEGGHPESPAPCRQKLLSAAPAWYHKSTSTTAGGRKRWAAAPPQAELLLSLPPALHLAPLRPTHLHQGFGGAPRAALHGRPLTHPVSEQGLFSEHRQRAAFTCCSSPDDSSPCPPCATHCLFPLSILIWTQLKDLKQLH